MPESKSPGTDDSDDLLTKVKERLRVCKTHWNDWREAAEEDYAFVAGDQWDEADVQALREQKRPVITFNRIAPIIDSVAGTEVSNRQEVRYIPRQQGDAGVNEVLTGAAEWVRDLCDAEDEESDAFWDTIVSGLGWTETRLSYDDDPDGRILIERVDPLEMYPDPSASKRNLDDARFVIRERLIDREEAERLWPEKIDELQIAAADAEEQGSPQVITAGGAYNGESKAPDEPIKDKYRVVEYQWFETRKTWRVKNPTSGQVEETDRETYDALSEKAATTGVQLSAAAKTTKVYMRAFICGDTILEEGPLYPPPGDGKEQSIGGFTYKAITGKRDRNAGTWYGLVRAMKDPQRWANKWLSQVLHIINANAKGGVMAETDAVANVAKFETDFAKPDAVTWLRPGAIAGQKVQPKQPIQWPSGLDHLMQFAISSIRDVSGVSLEMLGMADRDQPASLEYQRKQAAIVVLATLFDSLRRYRKEQGRLMLYLIREYISDGRLIKIAQEGQEKYIPLIRQPDALCYDIIVDEAASSPNQKEKTWGILQGLLPQMMKMPLPNGVWNEIVKASPLPDSFSSKIAQLIDQDQKAKQGQVPPEMQAAQMDMQIKQQSAQIDAQLSAQKAEREAQLKQQTAAADALIAQQQAEQQMALERFKVEAQMALKAMEMQQQQRMEEMRMAHQQRMDQQAAEHKTRLDSEQHAHSMDLESHRAMMVGGQDQAKPAPLTPMKRMVDTIAQIGEAQSQSTAVMAQAIAENSKATLALAKAVTAPRRTTLQRDKRTGKALGALQETVQ